MINFPNLTGCVENGSYYLPGELRFKDDCYAYVCEDGEIKRTNNTHPECCYYFDWYYYYEYYYPYPYQGGYYDLNETVTLENCTDLVCVSRDTWDSEDCKMCTYYGGQYYHRQSIFHQDCKEYVCDNGAWIFTGNTDDYCCYFYPYWYDYWNYNNINGYVGLNETVPKGDCVSHICIGYNTLTSEELENNTCCEENGYYYLPGERRFQDDCYEYVCEDGDLHRTGKTHPECCSRRDYEPVESTQYEKYWQYFRWWYYDDDWSSYRINYHTFMNNDTWNYVLNQTRYNENCKLSTCVYRSTWESSNETHASCCEYNGVWYTHGKPTYKDDCIGYVCDEGVWIKTNYTDPKCCQNENWNDLDGYYDYWWYNDYYEYWWVDYDFSNNWYGDGQPDSEWNRINTTTTNSDCQEVVCVARDTWVTTGVVYENCNALATCEFNGVTYNHTEKLPGCFKVYCIDGNWLQLGYIDPQCKKCYARWDPHLGTFDGHFYSYHGTCNYAMTQEGTSYNPPYGIFSFFYDCWGAACVGSSSYKDSSDTTVEMGRDGRYAPELYKLYVNGQAHVVADNIPTLVMEGDILHPVMAWKYGYGCIRLIGSSQISVQKCGSSLEIWVSPNNTDNLYGLCGTPDGDSSNDFTRRDLTTSALDSYPLGSDFPDSWEVTGNCSTNAQNRGKRDTNSEQ
ncbi:hypothetical protein SK128_016620, partial [Halocaridina rubra]